MTTLRIIEPKPITLRFVENGKGVQIIEATPKEQILKVGSPTVVNIFNDGDPLLERRVENLEQNTLSKTDTIDGGLII